MDIKEMPHVTVEQVLDLRKAAIKSVADNKALRKELEALKEKSEAYREQLVCEAYQYQEIYNYTNDGKLAAIALDHKERILELLEAD